MAVVLEGAGRFRVNVFKQRGEVGMVIRAIRNVIPSIEELQLPMVLKDVIMAPRGWCWWSVRPAPASRRRWPR